MRNVSSMKEKGKSEMSGLAETFEEISSKVVDKVSDVSSEAVDAAKQFAEDAGETISDAMDEVPRIIKRYPLQSILVGFGVGFLSALALTRKK